MSDIANHLVREEQVTGIQRILLNYAQRLRADPAVEITAAWYDRRYRVYADFPDVRDFCDLKELRDLLPRKQQRPFRPEKFAGRRFRAWLHQTNIRLTSALRSSWTRVLGGKRPAQFQFLSGDILLLMGCWWESPDVFRLLEESGAGITPTPVVLVHDLTPSMPVDGYRGSPADHPHHRMLQRMTGCVGHYLTFSRSTEADLRAFFRETGTDNYWLGRFSLPHEFILRGEEEDIASDIRELADGEFVLYMMSHHLPRKNLDSLLQAWLRLSREVAPGEFPALVIAGGVSVAKLDRTITESLGPLLRLVKRPSDSELSFLYRSALFTVFPSIYEGWGLPIGESLWHGRFCVTSNTSSMPEVGGRFCDYFDPHNVGNMVEVLRRPILDRAYLREREAAIDRSALVTWSRSARMLLDAIAEITDGHNDPGGDE
ncbi:MAG: glycosyltransferase [Gammaproteobacteria bacterium]